MMTPVKSLWHMRWSVVGSIILGAAIAPIAFNTVNGVVENYHEANDRQNPVVSMRGVLVRMDDESVFIHMAGTKSESRAHECSYIRVLAYTRAAEGTMRDAYIRRVDMPEDGHTKPAGNFDIGVWRIWPRGDAVAVVVYALHQCGSRQVRTKIAEVAL